MGAGPAGLPPPPTGPVMTAPPPPLFTPAGRLPGTTITQPRKLFLSSTDRVLAGAKAKAQGDVEGEVAGLIAAGFTDVEARGLVKENYERRARTGSTAAPFQAVALEVPDGRGGWTPTQGTFNRSTGQYEDLAGTPLTQARPRQTTGSTSLGTDREALARAYFGKPFALLDQTQQRNVLNLEMNFVQNEAFRRGTGTGQASVNTALDMPIGITAGQDQNTDPTRALGSMGGTAIARPLPQTEADKLAEYQNAVQMAEALGTALTSGSAGVAGTGTAAKLATLAPNFLTEYTGWGIDEKSRNAVIALAKQIIGKSFEGGVLRKEDEIKYKDILPTMGDAPEVAASKVAMLKTRVAAQLATHQQTLGSAGFRVGQPPPAVSGPPPLGGKVFDHTKFKVDARTDAAGHTIYIGTNADGSLVELVFRDGQYFIK